MFHRSGIMKVNGGRKWLTRKIRLLKSHEFAWFLFKLLKHQTVSFIIIYHFNCIEFTKHRAPVHLVDIEVLLCGNEFSTCKRWLWSSLYGYKPFINDLSGSLGGLFFSFTFFDHLFALFEQKDWTKSNPIPIHWNHELQTKPWIPKKAPVLAEQLKALIRDNLVQA